MQTEKLKFKYCANSTWDYNNHTKLYKSSPLSSSLNPQRATSTFTMSSLNVQGVHIANH
jgi:hypothetical protein